MSISVVKANTSWRTEQQLSSSKVPIEDSVRNASGYLNSSGSSLYYTETKVHQRTPILFSTNRGLHLRVSKPSLRTNDAEEATENTGDKSNYTIKFCDLERWSTNKANTVSLEDTIASFYPHKVPALPVTSNSTSRCRSNNMPNGHSSFKSTKDCNRLFNSTFTRFEE